MLLTNNKLVVDFLEKFAIKMEICWVEGQTEDVLKKARDLCHVGFKLLTHPLSGSVKPNQTPFKTIALEKTMESDYQSVIMIEEAYHKTMQMLKDSPRPFLKENILRDLAVIDLELIKGYFRNI